MKKLLAILLSMLLLCGTLPLGTLSAMAGEDVLSIQEGVDATANVTYGGEYVDFLFTPTVSGFYSFASYGDEDTYGSILDADGNELAYNDDGGDNMQFKVFCYLEAGTPYVLRARYLGAERTGSFPVRVDRLSVQDAAVEDVEMIENTNGYEEWFGYCYAPEQLELVLTYTDGTVERREISGFSTNAYDMQNENPWTVGNTYAVTAQFMGVAMPVNITIVADPVDYIEVEDIVHVEGSGDWEYHWDDDTQEEIPWMWYSCTPYNITVHLTDGTSETYYDRWELQDDLGVWLGYDYDQSYSNQWGIGEHTATIYYGDRQWTYTVRIIENPIRRVEAEDVVHVEGNYSYWNYHWDEELGEEVRWGVYSCEPRNLTVYFTDGTSATYYDLWELQDDLGVWLDYISDQSYDNQWGVGEHTATLYYGDDAWTYTVIIEESPVESVVFEPITYYEYTGGSWSGYWDEDDNYIDDAYYYYSVDLQHVTVTLRDGSVYAGDFYVVREQLDGILDNVWSYGWDDDGQSYENPWGVGEHTVMVNWLGVYSELTIIVVDSPVVDVEITTRPMYEGTNCETQDGWYEYYVDVADVTVTLKDGTVLSGWDAVYEALGDSVGCGITHDQSADTPWGVGTHTVTAKLLGLEVEVPVTILPSPVSAFAVQDMVLYQGIDSYENGEAEGENYDYYSVNPVLTGVLLKDGTLAELYGTNAIRYGDEYYYLRDNSDDLQNEERWTVGNTYTVTAHLMGVSATFNVTIAANPVSSLEIIQTPANTVVLQGGSLNLKGMVIRIHYADGSYQDITVASESGTRFYSEQLQRYDFLTVDVNVDEVGAQIATLSLFGRSCELPVLVKENAIESISVREQADKSVVVTVNNPNGTSYDMTILGISICWQWDESSYYAPIITDKGTFECRVFVSEDGCSIALYNVETDDYVRSNTILSDWLRVVPQYCAVYGDSRFMDNSGIAHYDGALTAENVDEIVHIAASKAAVGHYGNNLVVSGADLCAAIQQYFALESVDLTLSEYYDAATDIYNSPRLIWGLGMHEIVAAEVSYADGVWSIFTWVWDYNTGDSIPLYVTLDNECRIITFHKGEQPDEPAAVPGDANGDGSVNNRDVALLQQYINLWDVTIDVEAADVNDDGSVNNRDMALLQQYINGWDVELK